MFFITKKWFDLDDHRLLEVEDDGDTNETLTSRSLLITIQIMKMCEIVTAEAYVCS